MNNSQIYQVSKSDLRPSEGKRITAAEEGGRVPELQLQAVVREQPAMDAGNRTRASQSS